MAYIRYENMNSSSGARPPDRPGRMFQVDTTHTPSPVSVPVGLLRNRPMVRLSPVDADHVAALATAPEKWPPILVQSGTMEVIDGVHRVEAARSLGMAIIKAEWFSGSDHELLVEAVSRNARHGRPLARSERVAAAQRLLRMDPSRSDRAIAETCGLDHKTVGRLRSRTATAVDAAQMSEVRVGRDRRIRPMDVTGLRERIAAAIEETPDDSLRQIGRRVGASPETVRDVKARKARGDSLLPGSGPSAQQPALRSRRVLDHLEPPPPGQSVSWASDTACQSARDAAAFAAWFDRAGSSLDWRAYVDAVPLSRAYEVADQARAYAVAWKDFAEAVERRTRETGR